MDMQVTNEADSELGKRVGENVRAARKALGMPRRALAELTAISERYIGQLETGRANVTLNVLHKVATALDTDIISLISGGNRQLSGLISALNPHQQAEAHEVLSHHFSQKGKAKCGIALVGLRGAGKTTLGQDLAGRLGVDFVQLSQLVNDLAGMTTQELVELAGLEAFRWLEREALEALVADGSKVVLETSGGIVASPESYNLVLDHFHTVWIKTDPEEHMQRVVAQNDLRPMAGRPKAMDDLRALLAARNGAYSSADLTLDTSGQRFHETADTLFSVCSEKI